MFNIKINRIICRILFVFTIYGFIGCGTLGSYNAATGRKEIILLSTNEEIALGKKAHKDIIDKQGLVQDANEVARIHRIGQRLAAVSDRHDYKYHFYIIDKKDINAFTSFGGNVYIYKGLLDKLQTDDQIAAVLSHEVGHCAAKHVAKKFQSAISFNLVQSLVLSNLGIDARVKNVMSMSSNTIMSLISSAYSRGDEYLADKLGVKYLYKAGYDPNAMIEVLDILKKESKGNKGLLILRTHPYLDDRIVKVKQDIDNIEISLNSSKN